MVGEIHSVADVKAPSLREEAYERIKRRIIRLDYRPGAYINEAQICQDLSLGRTPVHSALERLAHEGMVEIMPRKGAIVRPVSYDEIRAVCEARLLNEPAAVRLAVKRATEDDLRKLKDIATAAQTSMAKQDIERLMELDQTFHATIAEAARNPILAQILSSLHDRSLRFWFISLSDPARQEDVASEHEAILEAIMKRDPDAAEAAMKAHIESLLAMIVRSI